MLVRAELGVDTPRIAASRSFLAIGLCGVVGAPHSAVPRRARFTWASSLCCVGVSQIKLKTRRSNRREAHVLIVVIAAWPHQSVGGICSIR
jgi:hypothetical protein